MSIHFEMHFFRALSCSSACIPLAESCLGTCQRSSPKTYPPFCMPASAAHLEVPMMFIPVLDRRRPALCTNIKPQLSKIIPGSQSCSILLKCCEDKSIVFRRRSRVCRTLSISLLLCRTKDVEYQKLQGRNARRQADAQQMSETVNRRRV